LCSSVSNATTSPQRQPNAVAVGSGLNEHSLELTLRLTRSQRRRRCGLIGVIVGCLAFGCAGRPPAAPENPPPAPVGLATTQELAFGEWTELLGATQPLPNHVARITAAVEGRVLWLLHDPDAKN